MNVELIENFKAKIDEVSEYVGLVIAISTIAIFVGKRINRK